MPRKAIFWDFDGTLIHANESSFCALKEALLESRHTVSDSDIKAALRAALSWHNWETTYEGDTHEKWWDSLFSGLAGFYEQHGIPDCAEINAAFKENVLSFRCYKLYDDACTTLEYCKNSGYRNYILSNNYPELPQAIEKLGLAEYLSGCVISSHIGFEKPRPEIFRYAMEAAGNPELCYMVGDNPFADIQGAKAVGIHTVLVHSDTPECKYADHICKTLSDITAIIQ